jgi:hypothetical protein
VETIGSLGSADYVVAAGAAFLAYLLLPPAWSLVSFSLRGYKGDLSPAQALDMVTSQDYLLIDVRSEKDKGKDGVPQLPSNAKNKLISLPYVFFHFLPRDLTWKQPHHLCFRR